MTESQPLAEEGQLVTVPDLSIETDWNATLKRAELCKQIVMATAIKIGPKNYIPIEGWQSIAAAWGMTPSTEEPQRTEDGYRVKAILRRDSDGAIISTAWGFVGDDEPTWARRSRHANEAMAQTRAMSRVCANKFRFIPVLMKIENLATTPYEEMPGVEDHPSVVPNPAARKQRKPEPVKPAPAPKQAHEEPPNGTPNGNANDAGTSTVLSGTVTDARRSQFNDKYYYLAEINARTVFTTNEQLGKDLLNADDKWVEAMVQQSKKPGRFVLIDFHEPHPEAEEIV